MADFQGGHIKDGCRCWCNPTIKRLCPECDGLKCELCSFSGFVNCSVFEYENSDDPHLVVHPYTENDELDPDYVAAVEDALEKMRP